MNGTVLQQFTPINGKRRCSELVIEQISSPKGGSYEDAVNTVKYLQCKTKHRPTIAIICGSGIGSLADCVEDADNIDYKDTPNFPISTVPGHKGRLVFGVLSGKTVLCMQGRVHAYEGYHQAKITFPIRVMKLFGIETLIVTNAAGGLNRSYNVGDIMVIKDHINLPGLCGTNPLTGPNDDRFGPRFPAMSDAYDRDLRELTKKVARELNMEFVKEGVYIVQGGPCFETVAECRMMQLFGADVTGMSTVPEVTVARHCGMRALGMSLVTNKCVMDYDTDSAANHAEVLETGKMREMDFKRLVTRLIEVMPSVDQQ